MTCSSNILAVTSSSAASTALHMDTPASSPSNSVEDRIAMHAMMASPPSDFSIDHILNRAGKWMNIQRPQYHEPSSDKLRSSFVDPTSLPVLNWLHYTRYHPPRPQKNAQHKPAKRTPGRLPRVPFSTHQLSVLEDAYKRSSYLSAEEANRLAAALELTSTRVKIWFQNRRARERREKREAEATADVVASSSTSEPLTPLTEVSSSTSSPVRCESLSSIVGYHSYLDLSSRPSAGQRMRPY